MLDALSTNIRTLSKGSQATVNSLIKDMKVSKNELSSLVASINSFSIGEDYAAGVVAPFSVLNRQLVIDLFRDSFARVSRMFRVVNSSGIAISSMIDVFDSEIKKVEKDIETLETFIDSYEFVSGKDDLFNYGYVERFNDSLSSYESDGVNFVIPDRSGSGFVNGSGGFVDQISGIFKMGSYYNSANVVNNIKNINITSNYSGYVTNESDVMALFTDTLRDSWNVTIKSPHILSTSLDQFSEYIQYANPITNGAQVAVEVDFNTPVNCDTLRFAPNDGRDLFISQVVIFSDQYVIQEQNLFGGNVSQPKPYFTVLSAPVSLSSNVEISFKNTAVDKMIIIFNQIGYLRSKMQAIKSEVNSKVLQGFINYKMAERLDNFSRVQGVVYSILKNRTEVSNIRKSNKVNYSYFSHSFPSDLRRYVTRMFNRLNMFGNSDKIDSTLIDGSPVFLDLVKSMTSTMDTKGFLFESYNYVDSNSISRGKTMGNDSFMIAKNSNSFNHKNYQYDKPIKSYGMSGVLRALATKESSDNYEYVFSLSSLELLSSDSREVDRCVFVSKKIPVSEHIEAIKGKVIVSDFGTAVTDQLDIPSLMSYELSISNMENPEKESDWTPLAFSTSDSIESEVIFVDSSTYTAPLRFHPRSSDISLYVDGKLCDPKLYSYNQISNSISISDSFFAANPSSVYAVSYDLDTLNYSPKIIDFVKNYGFKETVRRYRSGNSAGQKFTGSSITRTVKLDYVPYVRSENVTDRQYNERYGTVFFEGVYGNNYKPITIKFDDGSYAIDITNYTLSPQKVSFFSSSVPLFISNGRNIVFDREINQGFTVDYEYIPYSLRFRFIARKNVKNIDSSFKLDSLFLKMKTVNRNPFYDKLNKLSISS